MTLEEEKKLVIKEFFPEWEIENLRGFEEIRREDDFPGLCICLIQLQHWKPNEYRIWWDEIWGKMDDDTAEIYYQELVCLLDKNNLDPSRWEIHTAKPEICWQALVKALEG